MNDTATAAGNSSAAASTSSTLDAASVLTTAHLIWLAVFAVVVIVGIIYGARLKHRRLRAERQMVEQAEQAGFAPQPSGGDDAEPPVQQPAPPVPPPAPAPAAVAPAADAASEPPVTQLKGLGPKVAARLAEFGITNVGQIAALDDDGARALDEQLGAFRGRLERDRWVEQARFLAAGDKAGFEAVFGKL